MNAKRSSDTEIDEAAALRVALIRVHRQLRVRIGGDLTASQASALARIEQAGPLRLTALSELEGISPATMNKVVDSLAQRGLITRVPDPVDGRANLLELGAGGDALLREIRSRNTEALRNAIRGLSADEQHLLHNVIPALEHLSTLLQVECLTRNEERNTALAVPTTESDS